MKKLLITLLLLLFAVPALGATTHITATWTANTETDLAGYCLFFQGSQIADIAVPATEWQGEVDLDDGGNNVFELTAYDDADNESVKSDPVNINPAPNKPVLHITIQFDYN